MTVVVALLAIVVALLAVLVLGLLRTNADVLRALEELGAGLEGLPGGTRRRDAQPGVDARTGRSAVDVSGSTPDGGAAAVRVTGGSRPDTVLLFLSSGCLTCEGFWQGLASPTGLAVPTGVRTVVVTKGEDQESPVEVARRSQDLDVTVVMSTAAWADYEVPGSPYVALVDGPSATVIGEGTGADWAQVAGFLAQASGDLRWVGEDTPRTRKTARDLVDEHDTDAALLRAGITPGDPSLYPGAADGDDPDDT